MGKRYKIVHSTNEVMVVMILRVNGSQRISSSGRVPTGRRSIVNIMHEDGRLSILS